MGSSSFKYSFPLCCVIWSKSKSSSVIHQELIGAYSLYSIDFGRNASATPGLKEKLDMWWGFVAAQWAAVHVPLLSPSWIQGSPAQRSVYRKQRGQTWGCPMVLGNVHVYETCSSRWSGCLAAHEQWSRAEHGRGSVQIELSTALHGVLLVSEQDTGSCRASAIQEEVGTKWDVGSLKSVCQQSLSSCPCKTNNIKGTQLLCKVEIFLQGFFFCWNLLSQQYPCAKLCGTELIATEILCFRISS